MFDDVRLPENIERAAQGGPTFLTTVVAFSGGVEQRNQEWSRQRIIYDISYGVRYKVDYEEVLAFFYQRRGRARGFRFKDWADYQGTSEGIATANGSTAAFQLVKTYGTGSTKFVRLITRPVTGTVVMYVNGTPAAATVGSLGVVTLTSTPANGAVISADYEFDVPVRFNTDELAVIVEWEQAGEMPSLKVIELKEGTGT